MYLVQFDIITEERRVRYSTAVDAKNVRGAWLTVQNMVRKESKTAKMELVRVIELERRDKK